jgi:hypothetical protein
MGVGSSTHAEQAGIEPHRVQRVQHTMFRDRFDLGGTAVCESLSRVWKGELDSPPVRWRSGQRRARVVRIPQFARADLARAFQHGW